MNNTLDSRWTLMWLKAGAATWIVLAVLGLAGETPFGILNLLFLLAPLVVVPLGFELLDGNARAVRPPALGRALRVMQPVAAAMLVASFCFPAGRLAGSLSTGWLALGAVCAWMALADLVRGGWRSLERLVFDIARFDLAIAGVWLMMSRMALTPMGFQEPIVLLTALHFHFSGFATALIAGATLHRLQERPGAPSRIGPWIVAAVVLIPYLLAAAFVYSAGLKLICALLLAVTLAAFAVLQFSLASDFRSGAARTLLKTAAAMLIPGMLLVAAYAIGEYTGRYWLVIPQMARIHGPLNGSFVLLTLLGWEKEKAYRAQRFEDLVHEIDRKSVRISALKRLSS